MIGRITSLRVGMSMSLIGMTMSFHMGLSLTTSHGFNMGMSVIGRTDSLRFSMGMRLV